MWHMTASLSCLSGYFFYLNVFEYLNILFKYFKIGMIHSLELGTFHINFSDSNQTHKSNHHTFALQYSPGGQTIITTRNFTLTLRLAALVSTTNKDQSPTDPPYLT